MRYFNKVLFQGNGNKSEKLCKLLKKRLKYGLSIQSALQQGGHCMPDDIKKGCEKDIIDVVDDIKTALAYDYFKKI